MSIGPFAQLEVDVDLLTFRLPAVARDGDCLVVAPRLAVELSALGHAAVVVDVTGWVSFMGKTCLGFAHLAVRVGDVIIDATATQFDPRLPKVLMLDITDYPEQLGLAAKVLRVDVADATALNTLMVWP